MQQEDSRNQIIKSLLLEHEVHMARSPAMSSQFFEQLADRPIIRNWVWHGYNTLEPKNTILVTSDNCTAICLIAPVFILYVIFAMGVCLPYIHLDVWYRLTGCGLDGTENEQGLAVGVGGDGGTI